SAGVPVPPGFTITTEMCRYYYANGKKLPKDFEAAMKNAMVQLEKTSGKKFGDKQNPLLVSVRSGAKFSMPGMMDTILNLGMNDEVVQVVAKNPGNERFAGDAYRRFIQMCSDVVFEVSKEKFEHELPAVKQSKGARLDTQLTAD